MTEEAQPPAVDRAAEMSSDVPTGQLARYRDPSYTLPSTPTAVSSVDGVGQPVAPVDTVGQPGESVSEWARSAPPGRAAGPDVPSGAVPYSQPGSAPASTYPGPARPPGGPARADGGRLVPPPPESVRAPRRVDPVPGTPFGLVYLDVPPVTSGPAVAALVNGVGSILVAFGAGCLGIVGVRGGWGGWVAGAFAVLGGLLGLAAILLGELGRRQTGTAGSAPWTGWQRAGGSPLTGTAAPIRFTGRGLAISGLVCGGVGLALTVLALAVAVLLQVA